VQRLEPGLYRSPELLRISYSRSGADSPYRDRVGLLKLACALLWFRRYHRPVG